MPRSAHPGSGEGATPRIFRVVFRVVPAPDGTFVVTRTDGSKPPIKYCTCKTKYTAIMVQQALFESYQKRSPSVHLEVFDPQPAGELSDLWPGGLPNWQAQPFLPGECSNCGRTDDVTGYVYKNASGGYSLAGSFCRSCCETVSEQLQVRSAQKADQADQ